jgi:transmembrane sensor
MADDRAHQPDPDAEWEAIARFLAGESPPDEERRLRQQLAADPDRAALLDSLDVALRPPTEEPLSTSEVEAALASVRARRDVGRERLSVVRGDAPLNRARSVPAQPRWRRVGLRAAAVVLVVVGGTMVWRSTHSASEDRRADLPATTASEPRFATGVGRLDSLRLADGTQVILGPGSSLQLADRYGSATREVTLSGEAYFDVVHDARVPFVVRTSSATLRDIGTAFTVRSDGVVGTRVAVTTGAVDVTARSGGAAAVVLRAGDRAVVRDDGVHVERGVVSTDELSWTRGSLVFHDAPMPEVAAGLRRWFGLELVVTDSVLAGRRLTATFERGADAEVSAVLAAALGASATRSGDTLTLTPATSAR